MGFKPKAKIKWHHYVKPANFIYPDESVSNHGDISIQINHTCILLCDLQIVTGSTKLFSALLQRCLAREVVAICRYIPRSNAPPVFVALLPQVSIAVIH